VARFGSRDGFKVDPVPYDVHFGIGQRMARSCLDRFDHFAMRFQTLDELTTCACVDAIHHSSTNDICPGIVSALTRVDLLPISVMTHFRIFEDRSGHATKNRSSGNSLDAALSLNRAASV